MRVLRNVLFVTSSDSYLARDGENVVVRISGSEKGRFPVHNLEGIVCFGYAGSSPSLMALCCERGVPISFLSEHGGFLARVTGPVSGNVVLRRRQYRLADDPEFRSSTARSFVTGKLLNCRSVLLRFLRDHRRDEAVERATDTIMNLCSDLQMETDLDRIRGMEGEAARRYFEVFDRLVLLDGSDFLVSGRSRRPPLDRTNALLSFLYSLLATECVGALESVGLDPQVGFLHSDRSGRASLGLDLMEELRPYMADRLALTLINNRQVAGGGFEIRESGAVTMEAGTRRTVLEAWHKRKQDELMHPFLRERIKLGLVPYAQALLLARHVRGDLEAYPPFVVR
jgi:CRISPR-associated protein Cas1